MKSLNIKLKYWHIFLSCFLCFGILWLSLLWFLPQLVNLLKYHWGNSNEIAYGPSIIGAMIGSLVAAIGVLLAATYGVKKISDTYIYKSAIYNQKINAHTQLLDNVIELRANIYSLIEDWDKNDLETVNKYEKILLDSHFQYLTTWRKYNIYFNSDLDSKVIRFYHEVVEIEDAWKKSPRELKPPIEKYNEIFEIGMDIYMMIHELLGMDAVGIEIDKNIQTLRDSLGVIDEP